MLDPIQISPTDRYYIQDKRGYVGNCILFWRPKGGGYTTHLDDAGIYALAEARSWTERDSDAIIPAELIEQSASLQVDVQRLHSLIYANDRGRRCLT